MRLAKALAQAGIAARRKCDQLILTGKVSVNGIVVKKPQTDVDLKNDKITVDQKNLAREKKFYFAFNKPRGFECTHKKVPGKQLIYSFFKDIEARLFTVGRLDKDTTGLILLTNDGDFANQVIHPSSNIVKEYLVRTNKEITHEHLVALSEGCVIEKVHVKPVKVKKVRRNTFKISVKEGKKREVRLLAEAAGLKVLELVRIRIGGLQLGSLPEGVFRPLKEKERLTLLASVPK